MGTSISWDNKGWERGKLTSAKRCRWVRQPAVPRTVSVGITFTSTAAAPPRTRWSPPRGKTPLKGFQFLHPPWKPRWPPPTGLCTDRHAECPRWAEAGECDRNSNYMKGDANQVGCCRRTCRVCEDCELGDRDCYNRNRDGQGYLWCTTPRSSSRGAGRRRSGWTGGSSSGKRD